MLKRWIIPKMDAARIDLLSRDCGLSRLSAQVLAARGCTTYREAADFGSPVKPYPPLLILRIWKRPQNESCRLLIWANESSYTAITTVTA